MTTQANDGSLIQVTPDNAYLMGAGIELASQAAYTAAGAAIGAGIQAARGKRVSKGATTGAMAGLLIGLIVNSALNTMAAAEIKEQETLLQQTAQ